MGVGRASVRTRGMASGLLGLAVAWGCGTEPTPPVSVPISVTVSPPHEVGYGNGPRK